MKTQKSVLLAAAIAASPLPSSGDLVAYQGFNGYAAGSLSGQTVGANTQGLNPAGTIVSAGTGGPFNVFEATGMTFSNLLTSGGSGLYSDASGRASYIGFAYTGPTVTGNLYSSYLVKLVTAQNVASVASLRANTAANSSGPTSYFHAYADNPTNTFTGSQYDTNNALTASAVTLPTGTNFVVIGRFTRVGMPLSVANPGLATTFVLSIPQFDFFKAGGFTDAELDGASIGSGPTNVTSRVSDAPVTTGTFNNLASGNGIQFGPGNSTLNQTIAYDEFRFGTTLDNVLPLDNSNPVPVEITLTASGPSASEPVAGSEAVGSFTLTRAGATTAGLLVNLTTSGNASNGSDYPLIPAAVFIPAGASSLVIPMPALTDFLVEGEETATVTVTAGEGYILPASPSATVTLSDRPAGVLPSKNRFVQKLAAGLPQRIVTYGTSLTASAAWPNQLKNILDSTWPGQTTLLNRASSGMASDWGIANLQAQVIAAAPDAVFIEFAVNDAVDRFHIPVSQARANLEAMIDGILAAYPQCEIILQVMNPVTGRPQGDAGWRPQLAHYQQVYRDVAAERGLSLIDYHPAWQALLDADETEFQFTPYVPDGLHPNLAGEEAVLVPLLVSAIGAPRLPTPSIIVDEYQATLEGAWVSSTSTAGAYANVYFTDNNVDKGLKTVTYHPEIPVAGTYPVYLRWTALANRATNVPVTVNHVGGSTVVTVDQTRNGGVWFKLGDFALAEGAESSVVISNAGTTGFVIADAVGVEIPAVALRASKGRIGEPAIAGPASETSVLTVTRSGPVTGSLEVGLTFGGSAVNGTDYDLLPASVTIPAGAEFAQLVIAPKFDGMNEGPESLTVALTPPVGLVAGYLTKASLAIVDADDSAFVAWQRANFDAGQLADPSISGPDADPDGDGLVNLIENFAGFLPLTPDSAFVTLGTATSADVDYFSISYPRAPGTGLAGLPQISSDLQEWHSGATWLASSADVETDGVVQLITVRSLEAKGSVSREFLRLVVGP
ncbi:GDSL-type esterase/lipase family protein [Luteolibacter sp. Populi]|uniref:golvesin C-terminal-like domain-containing protein n=1 Tax=Luteolibacter sp. Populi TaxID=3230487 RepID=UPI003467A056